ncbi:hypothetical protein [Roseateles violae]|uniref:Uncharacterized protein n=1 Tax=Roseateles violae TaxID=3058042 RepID=A0ABT8DRD8_9BURK|nr:hypothetical protein [Pelomonas sp. PFR6]MDN3918854.1 hypothetical protein [Pelomonas sp. PFR6]
MGGREHVLAGLLLCTMGAAMTAAQTLPADSVENALPAISRGGFVAPGSDEAATLAAIARAVRADAARAWQAGDPMALSVEIVAVDWADASLGCPRPGLSYTQALVPGWRLLVRDGAREAVYHASHRGQWLPCPRAPAAPPSDAAR